MIITGIFSFTVFIVRMIIISVSTITYFTDCPNDQYPSLHWHIVHCPNDHYPSLHWHSVHCPTDHYPSLHWHIVHCPNVQCPSVQYPSVQCYRVRCVLQADLVCGKKQYHVNADMIYMFGMLTGSIITGIMSDRWSNHSHTLALNSGSLVHFGFIIVSLSVFLFVCPPPRLCLSVCLCLCLYLYVSVSVCLSVYVSVSVCLSVCLSLATYIFKAFQIRN